MKGKYRFEIKVSFIEEGDQIQVLLFQGSQKGKPLATGLIKRLPDASQSGFIELTRQLDGGKIVRMPQYETLDKKDELL